MSTAHNDARILRGMERQLRIRQARLDAGEKPLGWKVGFGSPAAMEGLGIDAPLIGFMTDKSLLPSEGDGLHQRMDESPLPSQKLLCTWAKI